LKGKLNNTKMQDRKTKRTILKEGYVNVEWFVENIKNQCNYRGCGFHININMGEQSNSTEKTK